MRAQTVVLGLVLIAGMVSARDGTPANGYMTLPAHAVYQPGMQGVSNGTFRLLAPRGGRVSAQAVYMNAGGPLETLTASVSELKHEDGKAGVGGDKLLIRYGSRERDLTGRDDVKVPPYPTYDTLAEKFRPGETNQPVWLTVTVPREAPAGTYTGILTLNEFNVPVELRVVDFVLPPKSEWPFNLRCVQSPDSVALRYGVKPFSDEHFRLLEKSLHWMGVAGNSVMTITALQRDLMDTRWAMVRFRRDADGGLQPEFSALDKYLALYVRQCGLPRIVVLHLWSLGMWNADEFPVTEILADGSMQTLMLPAYPANGELWKAVIDGVAQRLAALNLPRSAMVLGLASDAQPPDRTLEMFRKIAPDLNWATLTHGYGYAGVPQGLMATHSAGTPTAAPKEKVEAIKQGTWSGRFLATYAELPFSPGPIADNAIIGGWDARFARISYPRGLLGPSNSCEDENEFISKHSRKQGYHPGIGGFYYGLGQWYYLKWRMMPCFSVCRIRPGRRAGGTDVRLDDDSNFQGMGLMGLDFWYLPGELKEGYKQRSGRRKPKPFHLFSTGYTGGGYHRLIGNRAAVRLTAPGPDGALASARIELMGEGFQETAVRCWLERAIVEGKASPALARLYSEVSRHHLFYRYVGANSAAQLHELRMLTDRGDSLYRGYLRLLATAALMQKEAE